MHRYVINTTLERNESTCEARKEEVGHESTDIVRKSLQSQPEKPDILRHFR